MALRSPMTYRAYCHWFPNYNIKESFKTATVQMKNEQNLTPLTFTLKLLIMLLKFILLDVVAYDCNPNA